MSEADRGPKDLPDHPFGPEAHALGGKNLDELLAAAADLARELSDDLGPAGDPRLQEGGPEDLSSRSTSLNPSGGDATQTLEQSLEQVETLLSETKGELAADPPRADGLQPGSPATGTADSTPAAVKPRSPSHEGPADAPELDDPVFYPNSELPADDLRTQVAQENLSAATESDPAAELGLLDDLTVSEVEGGEVGFFGEPIKKGKGRKAAPSIPLPSEQPPPAKSVDAESVPPTNDRPASVPTGPNSASVQLGGGFMDELTQPGPGDPGTAFGTSADPRSTRGGQASGGLIAGADVPSKEEPGAREASASRLAGLVEVPQAGSTHGFEMEDAEEEESEPSEADEAGEHPIESESSSGPSSLQRVMMRAAQLAEIPVYSVANLGATLFELADRPLAKTPERIKTIAGWVAVASSMTALATWLWLLLQ